jgi:hypothetical protein
MNVQGSSGTADYDFDVYRSSNGSNTSLVNSSFANIQSTYAFDTLLSNGTVTFNEQDTVIVRVHVDAASGGNINIHSFTLHFKTQDEA